MPWIVLGLLGLGVAAALLGRSAAKWAAPAPDIASEGLKQFMARRPLSPLTDGERHRLDRLQPQVRDKVAALRASLNARGLDFFVGSTVRSEAEQAEKVAQGRSATKRSWHRPARAVDLYMFKPDGTLDMKARGKDAYRAMHTEAEALGFRVLGFKELKTASGKTFSDPYHIELREGLSFDNALARYQAGTDRSADGKAYA